MKVTGSLPYPVTFPSMDSTSYSQYQAWVLSCGVDLILNHKITGCTHEIYCNSGHFLLGYLLLCPSGFTEDSDYRYTSYSGASKAPSSTMKVSHQKGNFQSVLTWFFHILWLLSLAIRYYHHVLKENQEHRMYPILF